MAAVCEAEKVKQVILLGNSLGGPVAIEAALLLPGKAIGVIGVDTFHTLDEVFTPEEMRQRAEAFRKDYAGSVRQMIRALFHEDADPALVADAERRMSGTPPRAAYQMFLGMAGYNPADSARQLTVPLRAVNGDLYPTDIAGVRKVKRDFGAVVMAHTGHYPMLERPEEFNRNLAEIVARLTK